MGSKIKLKPKQFAKQLPQWYDKYRNANPRYFVLEQQLTRKASKIGHLDVPDLVAIALWGGNQYNRAGKVKKANTDSEVIIKTRKAIQNLPLPGDALSAMLSINQWGLTFASKTLRFICPQNYGALDRLLLRGISQRYLSAINQVERYGQFLQLCEHIRTRVSAPGPREKGTWFIADVEMALFQFIWDGGQIV